MIDILIKNGFLLTMKGEGVGTIENGAVVIEGDEEGAPIRNVDN